ncbi:hypothetical protein H6G54_15280 [Anabaena cylindrica FACHB-243]|uniref:Uncharacterized protein n=1 Tax=Anabaena cylindrica (strain ATCC 27899 / PCC 7122) TaxID=272123 RepID=K9ZN13_ANACC|nr:MULTISPECIES: hypothetical protein [Anabaena]AFZ59942.1 hypothetical protein Anacy_4590 [Anabaena cylindrica PCC 7122]MBD2419035.1 hypothetical protein [Anabaena cylindrica FACHB-243]MBY5282684.1 hypothetical protein [Anabaena sp. CCAP 1446/1C]MBY5307560.1 hypothetical protein [Anabaena sp. CCAP 1446/1C]MCM2404917.1 hypothetical protein [Anabaena sp. CCAP 1446/1C]
MPARNYPPAYLRYLKARLSNFFRPSFWGTGIFLIVVALVIREYWKNPALFTEKPNQGTVVSEKVEEASLSNEDKAITADIDNMPSLLSDFDRENLSAIITTSSKNTQIENAINQKNADVNPAKSNLGLGIVSQISPDSVKNPLMVQATKLLQPVKVNSNNQFLGLNNLVVPSSTEVVEVSNLNFELNDQTTNNQTPVLINPLATAINRSSNTSQIKSFSSNGNVRSIVPINSLPNQGLPSNSSMGYIQPGLVNQSQNTYSTFNNVQTIPNQETPTTGLTPVPNNPYGVNSPSRDVVNSTAAVGYGNYGNYNLQQPSQLPQSNLSYPGQVQQYPR